MNSGEISDSLPIDLISEILSRLPAKSVGRFRCVSKLRRSILFRQDFTELFFTRSSARPRLLFVLQRANDELLVFSSPEPQNPYEKSLVVTADFHMKLPRGQMLGQDLCSYASGLIYVPDYKISKDVEFVVCNPIMGQYVTLPEVAQYRKATSFLGFDPIDKQFKVVAEAYTGCNEDNHHEILRLGTGKLRWRGNNHCPPYYGSLYHGICISGVLYYLAEHSNEFSKFIVCVDIRSEKFKFIDAKCFSDPCATKLINYKGKLGGINLTYDNADAIVLDMWVLEDVKNQEWSNYIYTLPEHEVVVSNVFVAGMTARGEIVLSEKFTSKPFYVFFFNPERNTLQRVDIQGVGVNGEAFETDCRVFAYVDYVEDLQLNILKKTCAETSISVPRQKRKPTSTSTSSYKNDHQVRTSTSYGQYRQVRTSTSSSGQYRQVWRTSTSSGQYRQVRTSTSSSGQSHQVRTSTSSSRNDRQVRTSTSSSRNDRQVRT